MQLVPRDAGDEISLVPDGTEVAFGPIKDSEVAAVTVAASNRAVPVKGTHGTARALVDMGALVHAVNILIPEARCQFRAWDLHCCPYAIGHVSDKTWI